MQNNIVKKTDSYKYTHYRQYWPGTQFVYSYFESRNGALFNKTLWYGLQYYLKEYLAGQVVTKEKIDQAERRALKHFGSLNGTFNRPMWEHVLQMYSGRLPILIKAVPEGTLVDVSNVLMSIQNTDPFCFQLTNHVESLLSKVWYPSTVATLSKEIKKMVQDYTEWTCSSDALVPFTLHDFGLRGASSEESAALGGSAHLINFLGTDTGEGMDLAEEYYSANEDGLAYSVPATEHAIMTQKGPSGEEELMEYLLGLYSPEQIFAWVIDSFNYRRFIEIAGTKLKKIIDERIGKGKIVFRPDSGDPVSVSLEVIEGLSKYWGYKVNAKGYKELPSHIGILWGDGIDYQGIRNILFAFKNAGWAANNIIFGMGGALLQKPHRDTQRFAFKCSAQCRDGTWYDISKNPLDASKASKPGRLKLGRNSDGHFFTVKDNSEDYQDLLVPVFKDGVILKEYTFDEIRANSNAK